MQGQTILFIVLSGIIALLLALFQYAHRSKLNKLSLLFTFLRFITYFSVLLLLINPKFEKVKYYNEKPNLVVAIDNSSSVRFLEQVKNVENLLGSIKSSQGLNDKFNIEYYTFGSELKNSDSIAFNESRTNLSKVFSNLDQIYQNSVSPTLLISDGNQTYGYDYEFTASDYDQPVYSIILGDTITYSDLKLEQINVNRYAYLKNKFPVEAIISYNGNNPVKSDFIIKKGNQTVFRKPITLSKLENSQIINFTLPANSVGVMSYRAEIVPLSIEKNRVNNIKDFGVEVIDQKSNIALISDIIHPDLGAIKKSIESNEQRTVTILTPNEIKDKIDDFQLIISYQPNNSFKSIYDELKDLGKNIFTITGSKTDWSFLNSIQNNYYKKNSNLTEDFQPILNMNFNTFIVNDLNFQSFPPLTSFFEPIEFKTRSETILFKTVNGIATDQPLLSVLEFGSRREAILFGEGIWKWRAQGFMSEKSFIGFDNFMAKLVLYLASNNKKNRLSVNYESFYYGNDDIIISAQYFNKNYEVDSSGNSMIEIKNEDTGGIRTFPFVFARNKYQVNLNSLASSNYSFVVKVGNGLISQSDTFKILEYNVEQQFLNANVTKLKRIATNTKGNSYFIKATSNLFSDLLKDDRYKTIQKSNKNTVPLIDFKILLILIILSLTIEWFLRKYNGLI